jgi:hypothetical protein
MKRSVAAIIGLVLALVGLVAAPASAATPYCGIRWGSLEKSVSVGSTGPVVNVRSGRHACFDRIVFDVAGQAGGYTVHYVTGFADDGSGAPVAARGGAKLLVQAFAPSYDDHGDATYEPANPAEVVDVTGYRTFRQVVWLGSFEGSTTLGVGVRARLPFRAFILDGPGGGSRIVVDVAHLW